MDNIVSIKKINNEEENEFIDHYYTTQMDAAKKGIITKEVEVVAKKENMDTEVLRILVAEGKVVIPANKNHKSLNAEGVGQGLKTKINVNLTCCAK